MDPVVVFNPLGMNENNEGLKLGHMKDLFMLACLKFLTELRNINEDFDKKLKDRLFGIKQLTHSMRKEQKEEPKEILTQHIDLFELEENQHINLRCIIARNWSMLDLQ